MHRQNRVAPSCARIGVQAMRATGLVECFVTKTCEPIRAQEGGEANINTGVEAKTGGRCVQSAEEEPRYSHYTRGK